MLLKIIVFLLFFHTRVTSTSLVDQCSCSDVCKEENKELLGQGTWRLLHSIVDNVERTEYNEDLFKHLVHSLKHLYPCLKCRRHLQKLSLQSIEMTPLWVCNFHNSVNERLGKKIYNCSSYLID